MDKNLESAQRNRFTISDDDRQQYFTKKLDLPDVNKMRLFHNRNEDLKDELTDRKSKLNRSVEFNKTFHKRTKTSHLDGQESNDKNKESELPK